MRHEWDAVVIGAGIIGLAVGRELSRRGASTLIIDAHAASSGATQASAGMLAPHIEAAGHEPLHRLTTRSLALYDRFIADVGQDAGTTIEYGRRGTLEVAFDAAEADRLAAAAAALQHAGVTAQWLDGPGAASMEPAMAEPLGGLFIAEHGYVRVGELAAALAAAARQHGATVLEHCGVDGLTLQGEDDLRVSAAGASHRARRVVVAAGSWSGAPALQGPPVKPVRGQLIQLGWTGPAVTRVIWSEHCYIVPWSDGSLLVGATVEDAGFDQRNTVDGVRRLMNAACGVLPGASGATFAGARAGLRPGTPDGLPFIGASPRHPALIFATGHYRNGVLLAPLTAALVADLALDGRSDPDLALTAAER